MIEAIGVLADEVTALEQQVAKMVSEVTMTRQAATEEIARLEAKVAKWKRKAKK